jgi:hypothetical protein
MPRMHWKKYDKHRENFAGAILSHREWHTGSTTIPGMKITNRNGFMYFTDIISTRPVREKEIRYMQKNMVFFLLFLYLVAAASAADSTISDRSPLYQQHLVMKYETITFQLDEDNPPLYIDFSAYPEMITDQKVIFPAHRI